MGLKEYFWRQYQAECEAQGDRLQTLQDAGIMDTPEQWEHNWNTIRMGVWSGIFIALLGSAAAVQDYLSSHSDEDSVQQVDFSR